VYLRRRLGFVRVAIRAGADLVPVYHLGASQLLGFWGSEAASRRARMCCGLFFGAWGLPLPRRHAILTLVGAPVPGAPRRPAARARPACVLPNGVSCAARPPRARACAALPERSLMCPAMCCRVRVLCWAPGACQPEVLCMLRGSAECAARGRWARARRRAVEQCDAPSEAQVAETHARFVAALVGLFDAHKHLMGPAWAARTLEVVWAARAGAAPRWLRFPVVGPDLAGPALLCLGTMESGRQMPGLAAYSFFGLLTLSAGLAAAAAAASLCKGANGMERRC